MGPADQPALFGSVDNGTKMSFSMDLQGQCVLVQSWDFNQQGKLRYQCVWCGNLTHSIVLNPAGEQGGVRKGATTCDSKQCRYL